jgi:hypothetical protein
MNRLSLRNNRLKFKTSGDLLIILEEFKAHTSTENPKDVRMRPVGRVRETFELNQLKSAPSQLLPVFSGFDRLQTCCHYVGPANILFFFSSAG